MTGEVRMSRSYSFNGKCVFSTNHIQVNISSENEWGALKKWKQPWWDVYMYLWQTAREKNVVYWIFEKAFSRPPEDRQQRSAPQSQHNARAAVGNRISHAWVLRDTFPVNTMALLGYKKPHMIMVEVVPLSESLLSFQFVSITQSFPPSSPNPD